MKEIDYTSVISAATAAALFTITGSAIAAAIGLVIILATSLIHIITNN